MPDPNNPWGIRFMAMFHMANDSHLFRTASGEELLSLYEAKMIRQFDHRFATYEDFLSPPTGPMPARVPARVRVFYRCRPSQWYDGAATRMERTGRRATPQFGVAGRLAAESQICRVGIAHQTTGEGASPHKR